MKKLIDIGTSLAVGVLAALCLAILFTSLMYLDQQINNPSDIGMFRVIFIGSALVSWSLPFLCFIGAGSVIRTLRKK